MRILLGCFVVITLLARADAESAIPMWKIHVHAVTVQDVGDDDKPRGEVKPVKPESRGTTMCNFKQDPCKKTYTPWVQSSVDEGGTIRFTHSRGGAPDEVVDCALQVLANLKLPGPPGEQRVAAKVSFEKTVYHSPL